MKAKPKRASSRGRPRKSGEHNDRPAPRACVVCGGPGPRTRVNGGFAHAWCRMRRSYR